MNGSLRFVSLKMVVLGLSLSALSTAGVVVMAQQRPNPALRGGDGYGNAAVSVRVDAPAAGAAGATAAAADDARIAGSREVSTPHAGDKLIDSRTGRERVPVVTDWSTRHVVFAKPRTEADAARLEHNTRYKMQVYRRNAPAFRKLADALVDNSNLLDRFTNRAQDPNPRPTKADPVHRDWSVNLNGNVGEQTPTPNVGASQFPAKYTFNINAAPDCVNDFVVYNTNTHLLVAFNNLYTMPDGSGICSGSGPKVMWAYYATTNGGVTSTSPVLSYEGTQVAFVESSASGSVLHIIKWKKGQGTIASPIYASQVTGAPSDWTACPTYYGGCEWNVPFAQDYIGHTGINPDVTVNAAGADGRPRPDNYTTQAPATDSNSAPYYDYDTDILYVGTDTANLHEFTNVFQHYSTAQPSENTATWPVYMNTTANPALTGPVEDSFSGRIFVADSDGFLRYVETSDANAPNDTCRTSGSAGPYPCLSDNNFQSGNAVPDPPIVDSSLGTVMIFQGIDPYSVSAYAAQAPSTSCVCGQSEFNPGPFTFADFGYVNGDGIPLHSGDFDNNYYESDGAPGGVTGFMYVCAIDPLYDFAGTGGNTALRRVTFDSNGLITGADTTDFLPVATDPYDQCSPMTEVYNPNGSATSPGGPADLMFFSVQSHSVPCLIGGTTYSSDAPAGGCIMSVDVTADSDPVVLPATAPPFPAAFSAWLAEDGGTSGIIVDNVSIDIGASSIYFTPLGYTGGGGTSAGDCTYIGCAVKATQNGLN